MYETYFNFTDRPFASVPRIDHYYPAGVIDAARNTLTRCIDRGEGVALIVGPPGTGKSLLCQALANRFQKKFQVALLASTHLDTRRSLLQAILYELNRPWRGMDEGELRLSLVDYIALDDDCASGALVLVDEAHHLPLRLLDEVRALTNLTRAMQPAMRLVLAGNHLLEERFASPKLESFSQRISARCYLEAFQRDETQAYIWARIMLSGGRGSEIFPVATCRMVHKATGGVPRLINQVCDHVLLQACAAELPRIEPEHIEEAWADLQQLPTPWNAPAAAPLGDSVIEFGCLDDDPAEMSPLAGQIAGQITAQISTEFDDDEAMDSAVEPAVVEPAPARFTVVEAPMDFETKQQLRQVRRLLNDVRKEFQPEATQGSEDDLLSELLHPFEEPFEEEEVIVERYPAAAPPPPAPSVPASSFRSPKPEPTATDRVKQDDLTPAGEAKHFSLHSPHMGPPPPRKELGRLFAKLRRGI